MKNTHDRQQKRMALLEALSGNVGPLRDLKSKRGRPYSDQELEERRLYLCTLYLRETSLDETIHFFGRYDPLPGTATAYELPNGMLLYFP